MFNYEWKLSDGYPEKNGLKCFGTFICGGGSSMGYKLAGIDHLGGVEIDEKIAEIYKENHHPKYLYTMDIRDFVKKTDIPEELYNIDILDGSPPCSTFSIAGSREDAWGKEKVFAEGQKLQTLDDLFFIYLDLVNKLKPKVFVAENVSGLIKGNAKAYVKKIMDKADHIGYDVQLFLVNGVQCGLPQRRERCFFVGRRKDLNLPKLKLELKGQVIPFSQIKEKGYCKEGLESISEYSLKLLESCKYGIDKTYSDINERLYNKVSGFNEVICYGDKVCPTITATKIPTYINRDKTEVRRLTRNEVLKASSFPIDYKDNGKLHFLCGMSVPPIMTATIAEQICKQIFNK